MASRLGFFLSLALVAFCLIFLMLCPAQAAESACAGLKLCAEMIVPSLFPFLTLSALMQRIGVPQALSRRFEGVMRALFGVSGSGCVPFVLGLTGGYPVGAAAVAELVRCGVVSPGEGERMLTFVNNTGPAFIVGAAGAGVFRSPAVGLLLYLSHALSAVCVGVLFSKRGFDSASFAPTAPDRRQGLFTALPAAVKSAASSAVNICAFVVFFSVIRGMLERTGLFSLCVELVEHVFGVSGVFAGALISGVLELGGGIAAMQGLAPAPPNLALASFILGFGSLSVHCQTLSVIEGTDMKCARHFAGRIIAGAISALITYILASAACFFS